MFDRRGAKRSRARYVQWSDNEFLWRLEGRNRSIEAAWARGETDSGGVVSLAPAFDPTAGQGSVLWVSHPDFLAAPRRFELTQPPLAPIELVLEPHSGGRARVLGPNGQPVAGAEVHQQALLPLAAWPDLVDLDGYCRRALFRRHVTDASGEVLLHGISGRQVLSAQHGKLSSLAVEVIDPERIDLTLAPQVEVSGDLVSRDGSPLGEWALVTVYGLRRATEPGLPLQRVALGSGPVSNARYGPVMGPLSSDFVGLAAELIQGENAVAVASREGPPTPGPTTLDIEYEAGFPRWLQAFDALSDQPLGDCKAWLSWWDPGDRVVERWCSFNPDGVALASGLPAGRPVVIRCEAEGYQTALFGPVFIEPIATGEPIVLRLDPHSALEVRAVLGDRPVSDFEVWLRPEVPQNFLLPRRVASDSAGSVRFTDLPPGDYVLDVLTRDGARRQGLKATLPLEGPLSVELEPAIEATGTLIAYKTGEPIADARVFARQGSSEDWVELPIETRSDSAGRFVLGIGGLKGVQLGVEAPGFGRQSLALPAPQAGRVDLGTLRLQSMHAAGLVLALDSGSTDGFAARMILPSVGEFASFDPAGLGPSVDVSNGRPLVELRYPDGQLERHLFTRGVDAGGQLELEASSERRLRVRFQDEAGNPRCVVGVLTLTAKSEAGVSITRSIDLIPGRSEVRTFGLPATQIDYSITTQDGSPGLIGTRPVSRDGEQLLVLRGAGAQVELLCVDLEGRPVPGVAAVSRDLRSRRELAPVGTATSDAEGRLKLTVPEGQGYGIHLTLLDGSRLPVISDQDIAASEPPYRVVVGERASLQIATSSQGQPLPGVFAAIYSTDGKMWLADTRGNDQGRVEFTSLTTGAYRIELHTGKHLPIRAELNAQPADHWQRSGPLELSLHPYTPATLLFRDPSGQPLASTPVDLEHLPSGLPIQTAIDRGWLDDCPTTTDNQGRLIAPRLPLGTYRFRLPATPALQGSFTLLGPDPLEISAGP